MKATEFSKQQFKEIPKEKIRTFGENDSDAVKVFSIENPLYMVKEKNKGILGYISFGDLNMGGKIL